MYLTLATETSCWHVVLTGWGHEHMHTQVHQHKPGSGAVPFQMVNVSIVTYILNTTERDNRIERNTSAGVEGCEAETKSYSGCWYGVSTGWGLSH